MRRSDRLLALGLTLPVVLMALFAFAKSDRSVMDGWVFGVVGPMEQFFGRLWSVFPFSVAEVLCVLVVAFALFCLVWAVVRLVRGQGWGDFARRMLWLCVLVLWIVAGLDWLWNASYYASGFSRRSGLEAQAVCVEELEAVTAGFARVAGHLAPQVPRDEEGRFAVSRQECLDRGVSAYEGLGEQYEFLDIPAVRAKPLRCSRLQSILGFTGIYFPFTGEANVNVDAPACLLPATIAHEMAHQRMVAAEEEANFVGIAACLTGEDVVYAYSGSLMGLIHLSNALYRADPQRWEIIRAQLGPEVLADLQENNDYWAALASPVEQAAGQVYDSFLKGNDQALGMRSYGACVDLLVAWWDQGGEAACGRW